MATKKISQLPVETAGSVTDADQIVLLDVSQANAADRTRRATRGAFLKDVLRDADVGLGLELVSGSVRIKLDGATLARSTAGLKLSDTLPRFRGDWQADTSYVVGDIVINSSAAQLCQTANSDSTFTQANWLNLSSGGGGAGTITSVIAGNGLGGGGSSGAVTLQVNTGSGIAVTSDQVTSPEPTTAQAQTGTDGSTRMSPRRTRDAISGVVGEHADDTYHIFYSGAGNLGWTSLTDTRGAIWITSESSGVPTTANAYSAWSAVAAGTRTIVLGAAAWNRRGSSFNPNYTSTTTPDGSPLYLEVLATQGYGVVKFTPTNSDPWGAVGNGNARVWYKDGTVELIGTLTGNSVLLRIRELDPSGVTMALSPDVIVHPPWVEKPIVAADLSSTNSPTDGYVPTYDSTSMGFTWEQLTGGGGGDITSVTAGNGLTGGGTSGAVSLAVNVGDGIEINSDAVRVKLDGSTLARSSDGLKVADNSITATQIANNAVGTDQIAGGTDGTDDNKVLVLDDDANPAFAKILGKNISSTNSPADGQIATYDSASGGVTWEAKPTGGGGSVTLTDDAVLDLAKTTRTSADRGKALGTSASSENALALLDVGSASESTQVQAETGTGGNDTRMSPRRTRDAIIAAVGGDFSDGYYTFGGIAWDTSADLRGDFFVSTTASGAPSTADQVTAWNAITAGTAVLLLSATGNAKDGENFLAARASGPTGTPLYLRAVDAGSGLLTFTPNASGWTRIGTGNGALDWARGTFAITQSAGSSTAVAAHVTDRRPAGIELGIKPSDIIDPPWTGLSKESSPSEAEAATDNATANVSRMTPRRTRQAIVSAVGARTNEEYGNWVNFDWGSVNAVNTGTIRVINQSTGTPLAANIVSTWPGISAGADQVLMLGDRMYNKTAMAPTGAGAPQAGVLHIEAIEGERGAFSFTPATGTSWASIGTGNKRVWWRRGTIAITLTLSGVDAWCRVSDKEPSGIDLAIPADDIINPPWMKEAQGTRSGFATWLNTDSDEDPVFGDPLAPLAGATTDRFAAFAAAAPGDNLWDGDVRGQWGISTDASGNPTDANIFTSWSAITAGRRTIWVAKSVFNRTNLGEYVQISSTQVAAIRHISNQHFGGPGLDLANPGTVTEVGTGNAAYYRWLVDVTLDGTLVGGYGECGLHVAQPSPRDVAIGLASVIGANTLMHRARPWAANTNYLRHADVVIRSSNIYLCKTTNSDATFTASKWYDLTGLGTVNDSDIIGLLDGTWSSDARYVGSANGTDLSWQEALPTAANTPGVGTKLVVVSASADTSINSNTDFGKLFILTGSTARTFTLPTLVDADAGKTLRFQNRASAVLTVSRGAGTDTINGSATLAIAAGGCALLLAGEGGKWLAFNAGAAGGGGTGDITAVTAGNGLTGGGTSGAVTLNVNAGDGIEIASDAVRVDLDGSTLARGANGIKINTTNSGTDGYILTYDSGSGGFTFEPKPQGAQNIAPKSVSGGSVSQITKDDRQTTWTDIATASVTPSTTTQQFPVFISATVRNPSTTDASQLDFRLVRKVSGQSDVVLLSETIRFVAGEKGVVSGNTLDTPGVTSAVTWVMQVRGDADENIHWGEWTSVATPDNDVRNFEGLTIKSNGNLIIADDIGYFESSGGVWGSRVGVPHVTPNGISEVRGISVDTQNGDISIAAWSGGGTSGRKIFTRSGTTWDSGIDYPTGTTLELAGLTRDSSRKLVLLLSSGSTTERYYVRSGSSWGSQNLIPAPLNSSTSISLQGIAYDGSALVVSRQDTGGRGAWRYAGNKWVHKAPPTGGSNIFGIAVNPSNGDLYMLANATGGLLWKAARTANNVEITNRRVLAFSLGSGNSGDITSVTAGNGLTGGATAGDATLAVNPGDGIELDADAVRVKLDGTTLARSTAGLKVADNAIGTDQLAGGTDGTDDDKVLRLNASADPEYAKLQAKNLDATNSPTAGQVPSYDSGGGFTWVTNAGGGGGGSDSVTYANWPSLPNSPSTGDRFISRTTGSVFNLTPTRRSAGDFDLNSGNTLPTDITVVGNLIYVLDQSDQQTYAYNLTTGAYDSSNNVTTIGSGRTGIAGRGTTFYALDATAKDLDVYHNLRTRTSGDDIDLSGTFSTSTQGMCILDGGGYAVCENSSSAKRVLIFSETGSLARTFNTHADNQDPRGIAQSPRTGLLYVTDGADGAVYVYTLAGSRATTSEWTLDTNNGTPWGIYIHTNGDIFITDNGDDKVYVYTFGPILNAADNSRAIDIYAGDTLKRTATAWERELTTVSTDAEWTTGTTTSRSPTVAQVRSQFLASRPLIVRWDGRENPTWSGQANPAQRRGNTSVNAWDQANGRWHLTINARPQHTGMSINGASQTGRTFTVDGPGTGFQPGNHYRVDDPCTIAGVTGTYRITAVSATSVTFDRNLASSPADNAVVTRLAQATGKDCNLNWQSDAIDWTDFFFAFRMRQSQVSWAGNMYWGSTSDAINNDHTIRTSRGAAGFWIGRPNQGSGGQNLTQTGWNFFFTTSATANVVTDITAFNGASVGNSSSSPSSTKPHLRIPNTVLNDGPHNFLVGQTGHDLNLIVNGTRYGQWKLNDAETEAPFGTNFGFAGDGGNGATKVLELYSLYIGPGGLAGGIPQFLPTDLN